MARPFLLAIMFLTLTCSAVKAAEPVRIGLDAEFSIVHSTSAQAIEQGIRIAIDEINAAGGVLGGRPLELVTRDNRSVPARSQQNLRELADMPDMVAVFCGRYSPVVLEELPAIHEKNLILLDPWATADGIVDNNYTPNYVFRLSLRDRWAMPTMLRHAAAKGAHRVGLLLPNTGWGRSNLAAAERSAAPGMPAVTGIAWYNWGDSSLIRAYLDLVNKSAQAIILVANDAEGSALIRELGALPAERRLPLIMHWGVTGGNFVEQSGPTLHQLDASVLQTFSFSKVPAARMERFKESWAKLYGPMEPSKVASPVGVAQAYDLTHILAKAIKLAGTTQRAAIRNALERVPEHDGLIRHYSPPFSPANHEALEAKDVFMAAYGDDGAIVPLSAPKRNPTR